VIGSHRRAGWRAGNGAGLFAETGHFPKVIIVASSTLAKSQPPDASRVRMTARGGGLAHPKHAASHRHQQGNSLAAGAAHPSMAARTLQEQGLGELDPSATGREHAAGRRLSRRGELREAPGTESAPDV